jgi:protocatechuate 3,4-dioxygenase beta subunit
MTLMKRRSFLKNALLGTVAGLITTSAKANITTPREVEGPFYPITPQKDKDADLTKVAGKSGTAKGDIINIFGQVFDQNGHTIEDVTIDLWQANSFGKYHHPHDDSEAPIDQHFQAWAILQSGVQGHFKFKTVMPGAYPLHSVNQRTPHIHLKISKLGYESLLTQLYFPDHPLNHKDGLFSRRTKKEQTMMTAQKTAKSDSFKYNIILQKVT